MHCLLLVGIGSVLDLLEYFVICPLQLLLHFFDGLLQVAILPLELVDDLLPAVSFSVGQSSLI